MLIAEIDRRVRLWPVAVMAFVAAFTSPALAQAPALEVSAAYSYLADRDINMPIGWMADAAFSVSEPTRVVVEIGRHSRAIGGLGIPFRASVATYQGGVRFIGPVGRAAVFGQALGGLGRFGGRVSTGQIDVGLTMNAVSLQFGGGVIVPLTPRLGVRAGLDYRYAVMVSTDLPVEARQWRVATGIAMAVGGTN